MKYQQNCYIQSNSTFITLVLTENPRHDKEVACPGGGTRSIHEGGVRRSFILQTQKNTQA